MFALCAVSRDYRRLWHLKHPLLQYFLVAYLLQPCDVLCGAVFELSATTREEKAVTVLLEPVLVGLVVGELGVRNVVVPDLRAMEQRAEERRDPLFSAWAHRYKKP